MIWPGCNLFPRYACVLRAPLRSHRPVLRRTPGRTPFHPCAVLPRPASRTHPLPATPFRCPRSRTATLGKGAAAHFPHLRWPDCTLSRLRAEEYDRPVTQSIATREPSSRTIPTLDRSCRPPHLNVDRFHYPGASPYCHRCTAGCWAGIGEDCRFPVPRGDHLPFWCSPVLPPLRLTGGFLPRRIDGTTAGC